jgi:hypothetical protein
MPMVALGALIGKKIISLINQQLFQNITLVTAAVVGLKLIIFLIPEWSRFVTFLILSVKAHVSTDI